MINRLDELIAQIGTGWWNAIYYVVLTICLSLPVPHALGGAFLAPNVDYNCIPSVPQASETDKDGLSYNITRWDECTLLLDDGKSRDLTEIPCTNWRFDNSTFASTVTSEFQLTCNREHFRATYQSVFMFGMFFGSFASGFLADKYGRKRVLILGLLIFLTLSNATCWVPNLSTLLFGRLLLGMSNSLVVNTIYVLVVEISEPRLRAQLGIVSMLPWAFGMMLWGGLAYLIREWRWLQFTGSLPGIVILPFLWFMDESPRWLAVMGYPERALEILKKAARLNKSDMPSDGEVMDILKEARNQEEKTVKFEEKNITTLLKEKRDEFCILYKTPRLRKITLSLYVSYMIVNMVYYGLSLSGGNLSDDPFVYMVLSGLMEVPAYTVTVPIVTRCGRRLPTLASFAISGLALVAIAPTPSDCSLVIMALAMIGKLAISAAYIILMFYSSELFPTEVRSRGFSTCFMMSRIGSIISPFINEILGSVYPWVPSAVFGCTSILASLLMLLLPETLGVALPDTVAELENREIQPKKKRSWLPVPTSENPSI